MSDDELVRQYLLGDLPGDQTEALEERLLADDGLFELAEALDAEILEDYAQGELTPAQRDRVERYLAASPEGRLRLAVIRGLADIGDIAPAAGKLLPFSRPVADLARPRVRFAAIAAIAAMLVMALAALWLVTRVPAPPGSKVANRLPVTPVVTPPVEPVPHPPAPPDRPATSPTVPAPAPAPVVFVATLALSNLRGEEEIPAFDFPADTGIVELRLTLPAGDAGYPSYRVVLNNAAGGVVTESEGLRAAHGSGRLTLRVDAGRLAAGRYSLAVQGVTAEGDSEDLAFPEFEVRDR